MAITINLTRGRTATFPDGTSEEDIKRILDRDYPLEGVDIDEMVMSDPDFEPTFEQYKLFEQHAYDKDESMFAGMGEGLKHIAGVGWEAAKQLPGMAMQSQTPIGAARNIATGIESGMQGTRELLGMAAQSADPDSIFFRWKSWSEAWGKPTDKGRYEQFKDAREFQRRTLQMEDGRTMSIADIVQLLQKNPETPQAELMGRLNFDFDDPHTQKRMKELGWEKGMLPEELVNSDFVRGAKYVTDPSMLIPGFGAAGKGVSLGTKATGATLRGTGKVMRGAGGGIYRGGIAAGEIAEGAVKSATGVSPGIIRGGAAAVGVTTPGGQLIAGGLAGARATEAVGTVLAKAGEVMAGGPTRRGVFKQVAHDLEKGTLEYALARGIGMADKPIAIAGQAAEAGIHGGLIGGGLGFLHAGPEGFGPGFGAGFGMGGTIGGVVGVGQLARGKNAMTAKRANDVQNRIKAMEPEQAAMFNEVIAREGIDVAASILDWAAFMEGRLGDGAVKFTFNPSAARGRVDAPSMTAGKPTIEINLAKMDSDYTVGHEIVHGLDHIEDLQPIMHQIRQEIAGMWIDGNMVEQGGMTPLALETRYVEYMHLLAKGEAKKRARRIIGRAEKRGAKLSKEEVSRIHAEEHRNALDKFMKQHSTAEKRALYVADEIMAEHMARLIKGAGPDAGLRGFGSVTRRVLDYSLLKYKGTVLGGMIGRLTDLGIDPYDSMLFKNMEQAPPELNAMLRNLIRARNNLSKQIEVSDVRPDIITKRELKHRLPELKRQGLVKQNEKGDWVLKDDKDIEATEVLSETALMDILTKEDPDGFKVERIVDEKTGEVENVVTGRTFSPAQLEAINNSPAILPTVKENIGRLAKAVLDGDILNMDYYAATKTQKNRATGRYRSKYSSGIKKSNRNMLPYTLEVSKAGNFFGKAIDWTVLTNDIIALASKKKLSPWGNDPRAFINDFTAYLTNLATGGRQRSFEIFGEAKADFMHDIMAKKHRGGSKYVKNFRLDRMDGITPTGERARMNPEAWDLSTKRRYMPDTGEVGKVGTFKGGSGWLFPDGKFLNLGRGEGVHEAGLVKWAKANRGKDRLAKELNKGFGPRGNLERVHELAYRNGLTRVYEHGSFGKEIHLDGPLTGSQSGKVKRWAEDAGYAVYHQPMRSAIQRTITEPTGRFMPDTGEQGVMRRHDGSEDARYMPDDANLNSRRTAAAYAQRAGIEYRPHTDYLLPDEAHLKELADWMEKADHRPDDPAVRASYKSLRDEVMAQYETMLEAGVRPEPWDGKGEPYASSREMMADVRDNGHLWFFRTENGFGETPGLPLDHPMLEVLPHELGGKPMLLNDVFRVVHDYYGHTQQGFQFGPRGEYNAFKEHSGLFSESAQGALAAETLAQNAWVNFGRQLRRKDGSLPRPKDADWVHPADRSFAEQKANVVPAEIRYMPDVGKHIKAVGDSAENLRQALTRRPMTGVAKNPLRRFHDDQGRPIYVGADRTVGGKSFEGWKEEVKAWLKPEEIEDFRAWYSELRGEFTKEFGKRDADKMMMAWLGAQQNASPLTAMQNVFRVEDRLGGIISGKKGGLADAKIDAILRRKTPKEGFGAKLSDFVDSGYLRKTRTYVGGDKRGGEPFVADVHTGRDSGHLDHATLSRLVAKATSGKLLIDGNPVSIAITKTKTLIQGGKSQKVPTQVEVTVGGEKFTLDADMSSSPSGTQYEGISVWGNNLTKALNTEKWEGGNWSAAEVQAVGWMRVLRQYGLPESTVAETLLANTHRVSAEVNYGSGNVLPRIFPEFTSLPAKAQVQVTREVMTRTVKDVARIVGGSLRVRQMSVGDGYWHGEKAPSMQAFLLGSPEAAAIFRDSLAYISEQAGAISVNFGKGGKSKRAIVVRNIDGSGVSAKQVDSLMAYVKKTGGEKTLQGFSAHPMPGEKGLLIAGLTEATAKKVFKLIDGWKTETKQKLVLKDAPAVTEYTGNDWARQPRGDSYLSEINRRGGTERIRQLHDYRGRYFDLVEKAIRKHAPDSLKAKSTPEQVAQGRADFLAEPSRGNAPPSARLMPDVGGQDALGMFSAAERATVNLKQERGSAAQMLAMIKKGGVKQDELAELGLDQFLEGNRKVTKDEIIDHLVENQVTVEETVLGDVDPSGRYTVRPESEAYNDSTLTDSFVVWDNINNEQVGRTHYGETTAQAEVKRLGGDDPRNLTQHESYVEPGAVEGSYRELLLRLPDKAAKARVIQAEDGLFYIQHSPHERSEVAHASRQSAESVLAKSPPSMEPPSETYTGGHYGEHPNVLAHVRFNDRVSDHGKTLNIEEIQSDWHQEGRKKGYRTDVDPAILKKINDIKKAEDKLDSEIQARNYADDVPQHVLNADDPAALGDFIAELNRNDPRYKKREAIRNERLVLESQVAQRGTVPDAPFKTSWHELAMKRMIAYAVQNGYDAISWTKGETQAKRYDLSKQVDEIHHGYKTQEDGVALNQVTAIKSEGQHDTALLNVFIKEDGIVARGKVGNADVTGKHISDIVGKDVAEKIMRGDSTGDAPFGGKKLSGGDLKVGGEFHKNLYDRKLVRMKTWKKLGLKVEEGSFGGDTAKLNRLEREFAKAEQAAKLLEGGSEEVGSPFYLAAERSNHARDVLYEFQKANAFTPTHIVRLTPDVKAKVLDGGLARFMPDAAAPNTEKNQLGWSLIKGKSNKWRVYKPNGTLAGIAATKASAERMFRTKYKRELRKADK